MRVNSTEAKNTVNIGNATNANSTALAPTRRFAERTLSAGFSAGLTSLGLGSYCIV
jgi:hypothetical protein